MCKMIIYFHCAITDTKWIWNARRKRTIKTIISYAVSSLLTVTKRLNRTGMSYVFSTIIRLVHGPNLCQISLCSAAQNHLIYSISQTYWYLTHYGGSVFVPSFASSVYTRYMFVWSVACTLQTNMTCKCISRWKRYLEVISQERKDS